MFVSYLLTRYKVLVCVYIHKILGVIQRRNREVLVCFSLLGMPEQNEVYM